MTDRDIAQDAIRWQAIARHWKTCNFKFDRKTQKLSGLSLTVDFSRVGSRAGAIEKELDAVVGTAADAIPADAQAEIARLRGALEALTREYEGYFEGAPEPQSLITARAALK